MSVARFRLIARDGRPVPRTAPVSDGRAHCAESARRQWPLVVTAPRVLVPLTTAPDITDEAVTHSALSPPPFGCTPHYSAPLRPLLHYRGPSPMNRPELSDPAKRSTSSPRPSYTKSQPAALASEAEPWDFPAIVFLREHFTGDNLLCLFPHPTDPAASFVPPRSSSPTSSSTTSTTPSAPHRRLLPVSTHATAESPPLVSTPSPSSPPMFSYSGM
jgi:hypothetical protein